jgi:hypothetical protein
LNAIFFQYLKRFFLLKEGVSFDLIDCRFNFCVWYQMAFKGNII